MTRPNHAADFVSQSFLRMDQKYFEKLFFSKKFENSKLAFLKFISEILKTILERKKFDPKISPMSTKIQRLEMERNSISKSRKSRSENYSVRCPPKNGSFSSLKIWNFLTRNSWKFHRISSDILKIVISDYGTFMYLLFKQNDYADIIIIALFKLMTDLLTRPSIISSYHLLK